ncbi:MAG: AraC family transcriptional regulator [Prevotella sp.]|jgi:AraC family transcriptional activator of pobA
MQYEILKLEELWANRYMMSAPKYGFYLCNAGHARIIAGRQTYELERNSLFLYAPNVFFQILEHSDNFDGVVLVFSPDDLSAVIGTVPVRERLVIRNAPVVKISPKQADELMRLIEMTQEQYVVQDGDYKEALTNIREHYVQYLFYAICMKLYEYYFQNPPTVGTAQKRDDKLLSAFLIQVLENRGRERSMNEYARQQNLSPYYFSNIIKECSGKSAQQWIEDITMTFARYYLKSTTMTMKEIADEMKFPDQSTFGRYFKQHEGISPTLYREKLSTISK